MKKSTYNRGFGPIYNMAVSGMIKKEIEHVLAYQNTEKLISGLNYLKDNNILKFKNLEYSFGELSFFDIHFESGNPEELVWLEAMALEKVGGVIMTINSKYKDKDTVKEIIRGHTVKLYKALISVYSDWYLANRYKK